MWYFPMISSKILKMFSKLKNNIHILRLTYLIKLILDFTALSINLNLIYWTHTGGSYCLVF